MKSQLVALVFASFLILSGWARAAEIEYKVHVIISWDMSQSMRSGGPVDWTHAGANFLSEYFFQLPTSLPGFDC